MDAAVERLLVPCALALRDIYAPDIPDADLAVYPLGPEGLLDYLTAITARSYLPDLLEAGRLHTTLN